MRRLRGGEEGAFTELYDRYRQVFFGFFFRMLYRDRLLAEDCLQELFIRIMEAAPRFDPSLRFRPWAFTIAYNLCRKEYRRRSRESEWEETHDWEVFREPEWKALDKEVERKWLADALDSLPQDQRECVVLRYQQGMSVRDIAEVMGCAEGTVKSRLHYALKKLSKKWNVWKAV